MVAVNTMPDIVSGGEWIELPPDVGWQVIHTTVSGTGTAIQKLRTTNASGADHGHSRQCDFGSSQEKLSFGTFRFHWQRINLHH